MQSTAAAPTTTTTSVKSPPMSNGDTMPPDEKKESPSADGYLQHEGQMHPMPPMPMNGGMPPQQVYVNTMGHHHGMVGLEQQFQSLGMVEGQDYMPHDDEGEDDEDEEGGGEDDPVKLFVGQIPKAMNEEDIFPSFDQFGPLKDVAVIRDKHTGLHRGCAFVTYWSAADAETAQEALHDKYTFPGARRAAQVKPAEPSVPENKLFIGMLSRKAGETEVKELFGPFGEIREIYMIRNNDGSSKCAAFLRYVKREAAVQAIDSLHNNLIMEGAARPLIVKFADNKHQRQQRQMRNVRRHELIQAMGTGPAYPGYQVPPPMAMQPHNGGPPQFPIPPQYQAAYGAGTPPPPHGHPQQPPHPFMYPPQHYGPVPPYGFQQPPQQQQNRPPEPRPNPRPREGPAGANLFVYHLPHDLTDADLATAFNPFGNVISAKVYVDKYTGESKGFGFVSYDSVMAAEAAIEQMNGFQIGNKRLKVQHKRVHSHNGGMPQSQSPPPTLQPHQGNGAHPRNVPALPVVNP